MTTSDQPIQLAPYDPHWPAQFEAERARLQELLAPWLAGPVEHIGSTAVSGMIAKPVIDIMAAVADLDSARPAIDALRALDYHYAPYRADRMHWLCKPDYTCRTHHLHLIPVASPVWRDRLAFRDYLRGTPPIAAEYAQLKRDLARRHGHDREAYTDGKTPFVERVLALTR